MTITTLFLAGEPCYAVRTWFLSKRPKREQRVTPAEQGRKKKLLRVHNNHFKKNNLVKKHLRATKAEKRVAAGGFPGDVDLLGVLPCHGEAGEPTEDPSVAIRSGGVFGDDEFLFIFLAN